MRTIDLVRKGLRNPTRIPPFLLGRAFPDSRWGPEWRREDGFVTFEDGGFAGGSPSRPELSARIYYEVCELRKALGDRAFDRSLEVGCGYGRLSGWIADYAGEAVAIEPNADALAQAEVLYPEIEFHEALAGELPFADDEFDLVVSWSVLTHVPPDRIESAVADLVRVATDDATICICEQTRGEQSPASWPRSQSTYERLFDPFEIVRTGKRGSEPTHDYSDRLDRMVLEREVRSEAIPASERSHSTSTARPQ